MNGLEQRILEGAETYGLCNASLPIRASFYCHWLGGKAGTVASLLTETLYIRHSLKSGAIFWRLVAVKLRSYPIPFSRGKPIFIAKLGNIVLYYQNGRTI